MRYIFLFYAFSALSLSVTNAGAADAAFGAQTGRTTNLQTERWADEPSWIDMAPPDREPAQYLGQRKRRRGSGGRAWANLYYGATKLEPKHASYNVKPDAFGAQFGFDVVQEHGVYTSFFGNYNQSRIDLGDFASSKNKNYLFGIGKYVYLAGCHFGFAGAVGYDDYSVWDAEQWKRSKGDGLQTNLFGEFGIDLIFGNWAVKPFYALQYDFLYHGRIGEKGSAFRGDWNGHGLNQLFGLRLNWKPTDIVELQIRTTWVHEMLDNPPPFYHARFSTIPGTATPAILFYEGNTGRDWAWLGFGMKFEAVYNVLLYLDYDCTINGRHVTHLGNLGLCFGW